MTATVDILIKATDKASGVIDRVGGSSKTLSTRWTELSSKVSLLKVGIGGAVEVLERIGTAIKQNIDEYSSYVESVDKMSMSTGMAAEETSRLIQLADDFRVEQSSLTTAMKMALQNGFEPTVENLANLSDEYLSMTSVTDRAAKMQDIFGRQWADMVPMLEKGGDAIREAAEGIGDGLVVTDDAIATNREYQKSVDDLSDSWTAYKYAITKDALPALTEFLSANAKSIEMMNEGASRSEVIEQRRRDLAAATYDWADSEREAALAAQYSADTTAEATEANQNTIDVTNQQVWAIDAMAESYEGAGRAAVMAANNAEALAVASASLADAEQRLADAEAQWKSREGGDIASMLDQNAMSAEEYEAALGVIDSTMNTNLLTEEKLTRRQKELVAQFAKTKDLEAFRNGIQSMTDTFKPMNESIMESIDLVNELQRLADALSGHTYNVVFHGVKTGSWDADPEYTGAPTQSDNNYRCFVGNTLVDTPTGPRQIRRIRTGDLVNVLQLNGDIVAAPVEWIDTGKRDDLVQVQLSDGRKYVCSPNHPWAVQTATGRGFVYAAELERDMELIAIDKPVFVHSVTPYTGERLVYDIHVNHPEHTFLVGGICVHNKEAEAAGGMNAVIPPGYPNDSYTIGVTSGEHVVVTPAGQKAAGNVTYNIFTSDRPGRIKNALSVSRLLGGAA